MESEKRPGALTPTDESVIERILRGEKEAYEILMRRYNQRLFRIARSFIADEDEIEDVVQEAYIHAYEQLGRFENRSRFSTWLIRILINQALARVKQKQRYLSLMPSHDAGMAAGGEVPIADNETPVEKLMNAELREILEKAVDGLPEKYRTVYMMREIEGMSVAETSECLSISQTNVKVRCLRAKDMLRDTISSFYQNVEVFQFNLVRCDRIVRNVFLRIDSFIPSRTLQR